MTPTLLSPGSQNASGGAVSSAGVVRELLGAVSLFQQIRSFSFLSSAFQHKGLVYKLAVRNAAVLFLKQERIRTATSDDQRSRAEV